METCICRRESASRFFSGTCLWAFNLMAGAGSRLVFDYLDGHSPLSSLLKEIQLCSVARSHVAGSDGLCGIQGRDGEGKKNCVPIMPLTYP